MKLNKKQNDNSLYPIHTLINPFEFYKRLMTFRYYNQKKTNQWNSILNPQLKKIIPEDFYKRSTHICRGIYAHYMYKFDEKKRTMPNIIETYLHDKTSTEHYQYIQFDSSVYKIIE